MTEGKDWKSVQVRLEQDLAREDARNRNVIIAGCVVVLIMAFYLLWVGSAVKRVFEPEELALAASGAALQAVPEIAGNLREMLVDGAPDLAKLASNSLLDMLPSYRVVLEEELSPVIDEISAVLAQVAVSNIVESARTGDDSPLVRQMALQESADAAVTRLDALLADALDENLEGMEATQRDTIQAALEHLKVIDHGLKRIVKKTGDPDERELLMGWLNLLAQQDEAMDKAAQEEYRIKGETPPE